MKLSREGLTHLIYDKGLTKREVTVVERFLEARGGDHIADKMCIGVQGVKDHLTHIYKKLGIEGAGRIKTPLLWRYLAERKCLAGDQ